MRVWDGFERSGVRIAVIYAIAVLAIVVGAPGARADSRGVEGFAICGTFDPTSSYYVQGDPVYLSEIFEVHTDSPDYGQAFKDFLKQKYGWTKYSSCSVAYAKDGATKTFNEKLKQAGAKLVRTGWTLAGGGSSSAPVPAAANAAPATPPDPAAGSSYWVCSVSGADGKDYSSDIFRGSDGGYATFPGVFGQFVQSKYNVKFQSSPTCTDYGVLGSQQAQEALKGYASYNTGVMTGWKYGAQFSNGAAASASQSSVQSSSKYWVCTWRIQPANTYYVSGVFGSRLAASDLAVAFKKFVIAKYKLAANPGGAAFCVDRPSETAAQALRQDNLKNPPGTYKSVDTGWKYGM